MADPVTFRSLTEGGMGHPGSTLAGALIEFRGKVYIGSGAPTSTQVQDRARIHVWDPKSDRLSTVFESPLLPASQAIRDRAAWLGSDLGGAKQRSEVRGEILAAAQAVTSFAVFQGRSDKAPCLYAATMSLRGARLLRSENGKTFQPVSSPGLGDDRVFALGSLTVWNGRLYALPVGMTTDEALDRTYPPDPLLAVSDDPAADQWEVACAPGFGVADNIAITALAVSGGALFAGTANAARGFQLWCLYQPDGEWQKALTDGAERFSSNLMVTAMADFGGDLYLGTGIPGHGYDPETDTGPAAPELIRLRPDGGWDLVMGEQRFTSDGLKRPLSGLAPGFGDRFNAAISALAVQGGRLYAGTSNWQANALASDVATAGLAGGAQLWSAASAQDWRKEMRDSAATTAAVQVLMPHAQGLLVGTRNQTRLLRDQLALRGADEGLGEQAEGFDLQIGA
jgi:hypothetical protein